MLPGSVILLGLFLAAEAQTEPLPSAGVLSPVLLPVVEKACPVTDCRHFRMSQPGRTVATVHDRMGFLWLLTDIGVQRFDGMIWKTVPASRGARAIVVDAQSRIWVGMASGVHEVVGLQLRPLAVVNRNTNHDVLGLASDADGKLWIQTKNGLLGWHKGTLENVGLAGQSVIRNVDGALWVGTQNGVFRYVQGKFERLTPPIQVSDFDRDNTGRIWIRSNALGGLFFEFKDGVMIRSAEHVVEGALGPYGPMVASGRGVLIPAGNGLFWTDGLMIERWALGTLPPRIAVGSVSVDAHEHMWATSDRGDLVTVMRDPILRVLSDRTLEVDPSFSVLDADDGVWTTVTRGLHHVAGGEWTNHPVPEGISTYDYRSMIRDDKGAFWIATVGRALFRYQGGVYRRFDLPPTHPVIVSLFRARDGSMWSGLENVGIGRFDASGPIVQPVPGAESCAGSPTAWSQADNGDIWFTTEASGLCWFDGKTVHRRRDAGFSENESLLSLYWDRAGVLWLGGNGGGLSLIRENRRQSVASERSGLPSEIFAITGDESGFLWISSAQGLYRVPRMDVLELLDDQRERVRSFRLGLEDGLDSTVFVGRYAPSSAKDRHGALYFPNGRGLVAIRRPMAVGSDPPPDPVLDRLVINGSDVLVQPTVSVPVGDGRIELDVSFPFLLDNHRISVTHRMEGYESEWQTGGRRGNIRYAGIGPGRYVLRIVTQVDDRDDKGSVSLTIVLRPPLYQTRVFQGAMAMLGGLILLLIVQNRIRRVRKQFDTIAQERTRIAREMHDTLEQSLIGVKLQLENIGADHPDPTTTQQLQRAQGLIAQCMGEIKNSIWALRSNLVSGGDLTRILSVVGANTLRGSAVDFRVTPSGKSFRLEVEVQQHVVRMIQEGINNAIRHGGAKGVSVDIQFAAPALSIRLRDDGCGFDPATAPGSDSGHFGLTGMQERASYIGAMVTVESALGKGTTLFIAVPNALSKR